ncbi:MAG: rhombosortase [Candidatus Thiodiazotropha sp. (ex Lucinoma borealis)]|nr:rhombosortase [Candidatus Thiodiazotropha sp. (ex Lucinoma borealis)]MCU7870368.1 rhombosortase [Candidatus Thiodiazotropha sp. (ex Lucinoma borealis)]
MNFGVIASNQSRSRFWTGPAPWLVLIAILVFFLAGPAQPELVYDRMAIANGEIWRLITGHLVHSDFAHLLWDCAGLWLVGWLFDELLSSMSWRVLGAGLLIVDATLWWLLPDIQAYCGLSGLINALLGAGLYCTWCQSHDPWVVFIASLVTLKIGIEWYIGAALFTQTAWSSLPQSHAAGMIGGLLVILISSLQSSRE